MVPLTLQTNCCQPIRASTRGEGGGAKARQCCWNANWKEEENLNFLLMTTDKWNDQPTSLVIPSLNPSLPPACTRQDGLWSLLPLPSQRPEAPPTEDSTSCLYCLQKKEECVGGEWQEGRVGVRKGEHVGGERDGE